MVRERLKTKGSAKGKVFGFLIINIIPIGGIIALLWGLNQGKISLDDLPGGLGRNALYFAVAVACLIIAASLLLPMVHGMAKHFRSTLAWSAQVRASGGILRTLWECTLWLPRQVTYRIASLLRLVLVILSIGLILCALVFMIRFIKPDLLEGQLKITERMARIETSIRNYRW